MAPSPQPQPFEVAAQGGNRLRGESLGEGLPIVLCHGLTAVRSYVVHGSKLLTRRGMRMIGFDARGHGESDPAPQRAGYGYAELAADLAAVIEGEADGGPVIVAGHSMGANTAAALALSRPELVSGLILICPAYPGHLPSAAQLEVWDRRAAALEQEGAESFAEAAVDPGSSNPELLRRLAEQRIKLHRHPGAVAEALRQVPRSAPFGPLSDLGRLSAPVLVVASRDEIDPGHPYEVARRWADSIPGAAFVSEEEGQSPLAWQGGRLSREIAAFAEQAGLLGG